jgi:gamma-glutamyltranspeptidase / glutathione hydrolase
MQSARWIAVIAALSLWLPGAARSASAPPVKAEHGMVVSAQRLASEIGVDVLRQGGNAVDAAVAVGYALAVTYPTAGNLGGGGFMTVRMSDGRTTFLDFRERAPLAATKTMYLDAEGNVVKGLSTAGYLAVGVPGSVAGLEKAREAFGTMPREKLIAPALTLAKEGFTLSAGDAAILGGGTDRLAKDPAAAAIFLRGGKALGAGERLVQADLADTLRQISEGGPDAFYRGPIGRRIVEGAAAKGGILAAADFERYAVREREPIRCSYRGYAVISAPPPSSGGAVLCELLNVLESYPLSYLGFHSAETVHVMTEAMRFAYLDRNSALGDPDFVDNPVGKLTDKKYAAAIRARIDPFRAGVSKDLKPAAYAESAETTHYAVVDEAGNAVSVTTTLNGSFGTGIVAPGTGILLNNEMDDFTVKPGVPNLYGLVQGEANAIEPGKTPLSSMSPTILLKDDRPFMVIGSPGGPRIITVVLEVILNVIDHGMNIQEAVDAPRIHHQWLPDVLYAEPFALSPDTARLLAGMGHTLEVGEEGTAWGQAAGILVGGASLGDIARNGGSRLNGAMDSRAPAGAARGY